MVCGGGFVERKNFIRRSFLKTSSFTPKSFYSASLLLFVFNILASALNYVFQCMMGRYLGLADFGLMNALFALGAFISLPVGIYTNMLMRQWAELTHASRDKEVEQCWYALVVVVTIFCATSTLLALGFLPWIAWWLETTNLTVVCVTIIGTGLSMVLSLAGPLATARQWFYLLAFGGLLGAIFRIGIGWLGIYFKTPLSGAVVATTLFGGMIAAFTFCRISWPGWNQLPFRQLLPSKKEWIAPALAALSTYCICGVDLLIIRRLYEPPEAGLFTQVIILGRIIFFLIGPISIVVFPKTATSLQRDLSHETKIVRRALALGATILLVAATGICLFADLGFQLLRGSSDPEVISYLRIAVWCLIPLSLCQLIIPSLFARRQERYLLEFTCLSGLLPLGLALFRGKLVYAFLVEGVVGVILLGFISWRLKRWTEALKSVSET